MSPGSRGRAQRLAPLLAGVVALVALAGTVRNAPVWDDADLVVDNPYLTSWRGLWALVTSDLWTATARHEVSSFYRPLPMLTYAANRLFGAGAASYHAGNALLHAACAALVAVVARAQATRGRAGPALLAGVAFGVAPLGVEAVAWISGRFDVLGTAFVLAALLANGREGRRASGAAAACVAAALFCKESFVVAIPLLAAHDVVLRRPIRAALPKLAACALGAALFFALRGMVGVMTTRAVQVTGARRLAEGYAFLLAEYGRALVAPAHLDPFRAYHAPSAARTAATLAVALAVAGATAWAAWRRPSAASRALAFGVCGALGALAPAALTGPNLEIVGDRYAYLPLALLAFGGAGLASPAWPETPRAAVIPATGVAFAVAVLGARTVQRVGEWRDAYTLYGRSVADDDTNAYALYSLGALYVQDGDVARAEPLVARSLSIRPGSWRAENAMCVVRLRQHRLTDAERHCRASLDARGDNPRAWVNLASVQANRAAWPACAEAAAEAVRYGAFYAEAYYLRALCHANLGDFADARRDLRRALELEPAHRGARALGDAFRARGLD